MPSVCLSYFPFLIICRWLSLERMETLNPIAILFDYVLCTPTFFFELSGFFDKSIDKEHFLKFSYPFVFHNSEEKITIIYRSLIIIIWIPLSCLCREILLSYVFLILHVQKVNSLVKIIFKRWKKLSCN